MSFDQIMSSTQPFSYLLVLDFEATCVERGRIHPYQEIIEFPVMAMNTKTWEVDHSFHQYVQPVGNSILTTFCTELTGITQEMVKDQQDISKVLEDFDRWLIENRLNEKTFAFVTCGDWDLGKMLSLETKNKKISIPSYFNSWINIKRAFEEQFGYFPRDMMDMLKNLNIEHEGKHHSGIDDVRNICKITRELAQRGYNYHITGQR